MTDNSLRQAHLSLRWETQRVWRRVADALGVTQRSEHTAAIALALYSEALGQDRWTSYSRVKSHYGVPRRYRSPLYTYRTVVGSVDQLETLGLIEHQKTPPGKRGWQSAMVSTPELIERVRTATGGERLIPAPLREPILLRDAEKRMLDYDETRVTDRMRVDVQAQNDAIMSTRFGQALPFPGRLRRIFNGGFDKGGRFYPEGGSWQSLSKTERLGITIDGEPVVEIDFASFHPILAYAECGLAPVASVKVVEIPV